MRLSFSAMASSTGAHLRALASATGKPASSSAPARSCRRRSTATCSTWPRGACRHRRPLHALWLRRSCRAAANATRMLPQDSARSGRNASCSCLLACVVPAANLASHTNESVCMACGARRPFVKTPGVMMCAAASPAVAHGPAWDHGCEPCCPASPTPAAAPQASWRAALSTSLCRPHRPPCAAACKNN